MITMTEQEGCLRNAEGEILSGEGNNIVVNDLLVRHVLESQSLTIQWLPDITRPEGEDYSLHRLILGTHSCPNERNYLLIAGVKLPHENHRQDYFDDNESVKWSIELKINHEGDVNKACYMPQNPCIIASSTSSSDVLIFDYTKQPSQPDPSGKCSPELTLKGHTQEGYGLSWNPLLNGRIISASNDNTICLWDINSTPNQGGVINAMTIFTEHTSIVNDVAWHPSHQNMFGSVADDKRFIIWDTRVTHTTHIVHSHTAEVHCLSFNPSREYILATGSADESIALWDIRNLSRKLCTIMTYEDATYQVHWSPDNEKILATSGTDKSLYVWDTSNINEEQSPQLKSICCEHTGEIFEFSWNRNEPWLIGFVAEDSVVQIWQSAEHDYLQKCLNVVH